MSERSYGRGPDGLRPIAIEPGFVATATGSVLMSAGETRVDRVHVCSPPSIASQAQPLASR